MYFILDFLILFWLIVLFFFVEGDVVKVMEDVIMVIVIFIELVNGIYCFYFKL